MEARSLAYMFPTLIYIKHEVKKPAHLDIDMMGKFYCKNISNCCFSRQVWNYRWCGNFLAFTEISFEASAFLFFHKSCRNRNSGSNHVSKKTFFHLHHGGFSCFTGKGHLIAAGTAPGRYLCFSFCISSFAAA